MATEIKYDAVISDIDGVVYKEDVPIWENIEGLKLLQSRGVEISFLTNNASTDKEELTKRLTGIGINIDESKITTSGEAAAYYIEKNYGKAKVYVIGERGLIKELRKRGIEIVSDDEIADFVVIGLDRSVNYEKLSNAVKKIMEGAKIIVTNMDRLWPSSKGFKIGAGALAKAITYSTGKEPEVVVGKPEKWILNLAINKLRKRNYVLIIGDQLETDIALGVRNGLDTLLVLTGISNVEDASKSIYKPKYINRNILEFLGSGARI
jgi:4-nitrophenyl phosphatase